MIDAYSSMDPRVSGVLRNIDSEQSYLDNSFDTQMALKQLYGNQPKAINQNTNSQSSIFGPSGSFSQVPQSDVLSFGKSGLEVNINNVSSISNKNEWQMIEKTGEQAWQNVLFNYNLDMPTENNKK